MTYGYILRVYKQDSRYRSGQRPVRTQVCENYSGNAMMDLIFALKQGQFKPADGYTLDFDPLPSNG